MAVSERGVLIGLRRRYQSSDCYGCRLEDDVFNGVRSGRGSEVIEVTWEVGGMYVRRLKMKQMDKVTICHLHVMTRLARTSI